MRVILENISKKYSKKSILWDVNLMAEGPAIIGITGRNGCGKTTLLSIIMGIEKPDNGRVIFSDMTVVGYVPQINPLLEDMSVKDNLKLWSDSKDNFDRIVEAYDLKDMLGKRVSKLSGGMKRRLSIACAVVNNPKILIMDEPTAALDIVYKQVIHEEMRRFSDNGGLIIMVSHEKEELDMCDKCYLIDGGTVVPYENNHQ